MFVVRHGDHSEGRANNYVLNSFENVFGDTFSQLNS